MQKRQFLSRAMLLAITPPLMMVSRLAHSASDEGFAPLAAPKIIDALTSKDIVLDRPGRVRGTPDARAVNLNVQFGFDSANLHPKGREQLDELAVAIKMPALSSWAFMLTGHTDAVGSHEYNKALSQARAESVRNYLIEFCGIARVRLRAIGMGYDDLLDPENPGAAINRRVEVRRVALSPVPHASTESATDRFVRTPQ